jgi:hypothetical protein
MPLRLYDFITNVLQVYDLKQRITTAVASVDENMLQCVWNELDYGIVICHVTEGSHIEHL